MGEVEKQLEELRKKFEVKLKNECNRIEETLFIETSAYQEDLEELVQFCHKIAGSAGTFGFANLGKEFQHLELEIKTIQKEKKYDFKIAKKFQEKVIQALKGKD